MIDLGWLLAPLAGCLVAVGILGYLGLHVLRRQVIFVDLALAQIAALGATYAFFLGFPPESFAASVCAVCFSFAGAALFAATRSQEGRLPQEAIIGICYVVAAAAVILLVDLAEDPHGAERIRFLLVGSIVWAKWGEIGAAAAVCAAVGVFHFGFRDRFRMASEEPEALVAAGGSLMLWDLLFYASFGVAITAIVRLVGVLLVFSYLIIPGAVASLFFSSTRARLFAAWGIGAAVSLVGLLFGYEHPPGPVIVACFGVVLALALIVRAILDAERRASRALQLFGGGALLLLVLSGMPGWIGAGGHVHAEEGTAGHESEPPSPADGRSELDSADSLIRQRAIDALVLEVSSESTRALSRQLGREADEELQLRIATALNQRGDEAGRARLRTLASEAAVPIVRMQAQDALGASGSP